MTIQNSRQEHLGELSRDFAVFLPAISNFYNTFISKQRVSGGKHIPEDRIPKTFENGVESLNFINQDKGMFTYPTALYSAGHACLDMDKVGDRDHMFVNRDRKFTTIVGDSGGYQIGKGVIKFDWKDFEGNKANKVRSDILNWLELTSDWAMTLDVPTWAADDLNSPKTGLKTFQDTLDGTIYNNKFFQKHRLGQTKFLNVLQGDDWNTAQIWYDQVKDFEFEGWAMGGINMCDMEVMLKRMIIMRDEKKLDGKDWMHVLGTSQMDWGCYLTQVQRQVRKHINPNFTISFDSASAFLSTANGLVYTHNSFTPDRFSFVMDKAPDDKQLKGSKIQFPFDSGVGRRLTMGDVCFYGEKDLNKNGKIGSTSWDSFSYVLMMAHNVYNQIRAIQIANDLNDIESLKHRPEVKHWRKTKASDKTDEPSIYVPRNILYFNTFVEEVFTSEKPMDVIANASSYLADIRGNRWARATGGGKGTNNFSSLFE
jgi:hypothetical protein|tara:strand:+ start:286 stop:1734 length:1449 start_codon:yes stop_codon:yes gene_type:complete